MGRLRYRFGQVVQSEPLASFQRFVAMWTTWSMAQLVHMVLAHFLFWSDIGFIGPAPISGTVPLINAASSLTRCIYFRAFPHVDHPSIAMISGGSEYRLVHNGPVDINLFLRVASFSHTTLTFADHQVPSNIRCEVSSHLIFLIENPTGGTVHEQQKYRLQHNVAVDNGFLSVVLLSCATFIALIRLEPDRNI